MLTIHDIRIKNRPDILYKKYNGIYLVSDKVTGYFSSNFLAVTTNSNKLRHIKHGFLYSADIQKFIKDTYRTDADSYNVPYFVKLPTDTIDIYQGYYMHNLLFIRFIHWLNQ